MKTRDKILLTARLLFNEHGFGNVSLAKLAEELGIAKGNIWYHFNDKRALLAGINKQYSDYSIGRLQVRPDPENILQSYVKFITSVALEIREFRFMFRDLSEYGEHSEEFQDELPKIYELNFQQFASFYHEMKAIGALSIDDSDIHDLVHNVIVILRYNIEFEKELGVLRKRISGSVMRSFLQHLTILKHHMKPITYEELVKNFKDTSEKDLTWTELKQAQ